VKPWLTEVWREIGRPLAIIVAHLAVTLAAVVAIAVVEAVLAFIGFDKRRFPSGI
jgi:hypothetical protein